MIRKGSLAPVLFTYDQYGYLSGISQGTYKEEFSVEHETPEERRDNLLSADRNSGVTHTGKIAGRLLSDGLFKYEHLGLEPGQVRLTDRSGRTAAYRIDSRNGIFRITEFSGKSYSVYYFMRYDVAYMGKVRQILDARNRVLANYRYDRFTGRPLRVRNMLGNDTDYLYDRSGKLLKSSRRAAGKTKPEPVTGFRYDRYGNPIEVSQLDVSGRPVRSTRISYNAARQPVTIDDGRGSVHIAYSAAGYPVRLRDGFNMSRNLEFDKYNRITAIVDAFGVRTEYVYNDFGAVSSVVRKAGPELLSSLLIEYDAQGLPVRYTDHSGRSRSFVRDEVGRVVKEFFPDESSVEYSYNELGNLDTVMDQNRNPIRFGWSRFGLESRTTAASQLTDYIYDDTGLLRSVFSNSQESEGQDKVKRSYRYDTWDRPVEIIHGNGEVESISYDEWGRLASVRKGINRSEFKYDYFGRLIELDENGLKTSFAYNPWGQLLERREGSGMPVSVEKNEYDRFGRLVRMERGKLCMTYEYNDLNQLCRSGIGEHRMDYVYDGYGQLKTKKPMKR